MKVERNAQGTPGGTNPQWRKGGMTSNGLRQSTEVVNYFRGPARQNILPDPGTSRPLKTTRPGVGLVPPKCPVSSIGQVQTSGLKQIAASEYGPGTLKSTNTQWRFSMGPDTYRQGSVIQNEKRSQFVDYRHTDPALVQNLRENPLSIYAVGDAKNAPVPAFFSYIQPQNFATYKSVPKVPVSKQTVQAAINGSPNVNILGLARPNPLMGITAGVPNAVPDFAPNKTYGGTNSGSAQPYANWVYNQGAQNLNEQYLEPPPTQNFEKDLFDKSFDTSFHKEGFTDRRACKNKALQDFAQGYNVSPQINQDKSVEWVARGNHAVNNLPWGPYKFTGNPQTQQGGLWTRGGNVSPTVPNSLGYASNAALNANAKSPRPRNFTFMYSQGLPGVLQAS